MSSLTLSSSPGPSNITKNFKRSHSEVSASGEQSISKKTKTSPIGINGGRDKKKRPKKKRTRKPSVVVVENGRARVKDARRGLSEPLVATSPVTAKLGESSRGLSKTPVDDVSGDERDVEDIVSSTQVAEAVDPGEFEPKTCPDLSTQERGKGKATDLPQRTVEEELARLTRELAFKNSLLEKHENLIAQTQQSIICQVCLELLHKPYALAPCGHLACHECLVSWFTAPAPSNPDDQPAVNFVGRKKTCPHCRAVVRERPVQVWGLKDIVVAHANSELLQGNFLPAPVENDSSLSETVDPWKNIFRKPGEGGMAHYPLDHHGLPGGPGILDEEDGGLFRCYDCLHEIWDGVCSGCGRDYGPGEDDDFDIRDLTGTDSEDDDGLGGGFNLGWLGAGAAALAHHLAARHPGMLHEELEDDDSEGEGYESSFIEDDPPRGGLRRQNAFVVSDSEEGSPRPYRVRNLRASQAAEIVELTDSDEHESDQHDDDEVEEIPRPRPLTPVIVTSGSEAEDDEVEVISSPAVARRRAAHPRRTLVVSSDSEDEEEASDVGTDLVAQMMAREQEQYGDDGSRARHRRFDDLEDDDEVDDDEEQDDDDDDEEEDDEEGEAVAY
ncbi:hypothetical protein HWV62_25735 [Athelia sp. TMB]|nr:hypothetical protein HWV62_25735 [Athelia sp. TMB]